MPDIHQQIIGSTRDHGGGLDVAAQLYGGDRDDWLDLSTGINPSAYPVDGLNAADWTALPDTDAAASLRDAARRFWHVPPGADILPAPGASAVIARLPGLARAGTVRIDGPTYNEHAAAFTAQGWRVTDAGPADARVLVHPNNPDGRVWQADDADAPLTIIDESFCDVMPDRTLVDLAPRRGVVVLKSFGKFWGLAGLRLGFAIAAPETVARLSEALGPWPVSGPALRIGAAALNDPGWAVATRIALARDAKRLDGLMGRHGATLKGGTSLFRLYDVGDAAGWQARLARARIWTRIFPWSDHLIRLGLPPRDGWHRLETAL